MGQLQRSPSFPVLPNKGFWGQQILISMGFFCERPWRTLGSIRALLALLGLSTSPAVQPWGSSDVDPQWVKASQRWWVSNTKLKDKLGDGCQTGFVQTGWGFRNKHSCGLSQVLCVCKQNTRGTKINPALKWKRVKTTSQSEVHKNTFGPNFTSPVLVHMM